MIESPLALATFGVALVTGLLPFANVEVYLVGLAIAQPRAAVFPLVAAAAAGQTLAKAVLYGAGLGALQVPRLREGGEAVRARLAGSRLGPWTVIFASALLGVPPFYAVSVAAGGLRLGLRAFLLLGLIGRLLRFAAVLALPRLLS